MKSAVVIPARLASHRLPNKLLLPIAGHSVLWHTYQRAQAAKNISRICVAVDSPELKKEVESWGGEAFMTDPALPSGSARIASIIDKIDADIVVNVQGDEPLIDPELISGLAESLSRSDADIATAMFKIRNSSEIFHSSLVKVVTSHAGQALYFSRSPIPHVRDTDEKLWAEKATFYGHIGMYAFKRHVLKNFSKLPESPLENTEKLEQLRFLEAGLKIIAVVAPAPTVSVDTQADYERVKFLIEEN